MQESKEYLKMKADFAAKDAARLRKGMATVAASLPDTVPHNDDAALYALFTQEKRDGAKPARIVKIDGEPVHGKKVKHVYIEATLPELKGGQMYQTAHGEASGSKPAIARAFRELLKKIPGKRVSVISAKISITTKIVEG